MNRSTVAFCAALPLLMPTLNLVADAAAAAKPNVVIILADDLGYGDVGCYGATKIKTPNIDRLAAEGVRFTQAYTPGSVCSPTRYGLLAGRYFWRNPRHHPTGVHAPGAPLLFEPDRLTLGKLFQQNGYTTACIGKWHQGVGEGDKPSLRYDFSQDEIKPGPNDAGFDFFFGMAANVGNAPRIYIENHRFVGRKPGDKVEMIGRGDVKPWSPDAEYKEDAVAGDIAKQAVDYIAQTPSDKPFFLYFAANIAHNAITPGAACKGTSACGPYGDFVQELDTHVGWLMEALRKKGALKTRSCSSRATTAAWLRTMNASCLSGRRNRRGTRSAVPCAAASTASTKAASACPSSCAGRTRGRKAPRARPCSASPT